MDILFYNDVALSIREEIKKCGGNEVLFFGWIDKNFKVNRVEVVARGNDECVVVPLQRALMPDLLIHNHPEGDMVPSQQDMEIAFRVAQRGVGFIIINNELTDLYVVVEPVIKRELEKLDKEEIVKLISSEGALSLSIPDFEEREGQKRMMNLVIKTFNNSSSALIEAGTGIGKSIAYLVPAIIWSIKNRERVVVSTNTINLQEQLLFKDIPELRKALGDNFSCVLMKGRGNYVCFNRVEEVQKDLFSFIDEEEIEQFEAILKWIQITDDGSLSDLSFMPRMSFWEKINSQSVTCRGSSCIHFNRCFVNRIKRKALTANLIVTNHHYLLADAALIDAGVSILPSYERVIIDEAHNLEEAITSLFTKKITPSGVIGLLNRLYQAQKNKGYLVFLQKNRFCNDENILKNLMEKTAELKGFVFELFEGVDKFLEQLTVSYEANQGDEYGVFEINEKLFNSPGWEELVLERLEKFNVKCSEVAFSLEKLSTRLGQNEQQKKQVEGFVSRIKELVDTVSIFLNFSEKQYVRWLEQKHQLGLVISLVDAGKMLYELLFKRTGTLVLTSATLSVGGRFDFIRKRFFLFRVDEEAIIPSPFPYQKNMKIFLPFDSPLQEDPYYIDKLAESIMQIVRKTDGKAFILFTSYRTLNGVVKHLKEGLKESGIAIFIQGENSRRNLLESFKININSILCGTESFWEGVDAPGETLECVIITKLPFRVPTDPVIKARIERIREEDGNPFMEYLLPLAVIKMKQGVGRLIRKSSDRGIIVVLDSRIMTRSYGKLFLDSIPPGQIYRGRLSELLSEVDGFLTNNSLTK